LISYEYAGAVRIINMSAPTKAPGDSWMGWSNSAERDSRATVVALFLSLATWYQWLNPGVDYCATA